MGCMEQDILNKLAEQDKKLNEIYKTMHKLQNYFKWTFIITILVIVLPAIGLVFAIPALLSAYSSIGNLGF